MVLSNVSTKKSKLLQSGVIDDQKKRFFMADEVPECCGSGCTNCVLDEKPSKHTLPAGVVTNVFDRTYKRFVCASVSKVTEDVFRFRFRYCPDTASAPGELIIVPAGCHLMLRARKFTIDPPNSGDDLLRAWHATHPPQDAREHTKKEIRKHDQTEDDLYISRPYTPIASDVETSTFDVLIKLEPGGVMTNYLVTLSIGAHTEWKGLYGDFLWKRNQHRNVVAFVQGVAIAPVYSTLRTILDDSEDDTRLTLCACFRDLQSVLLRDELRSMGSYWNFRYEVYLSRRTDHSPPLAVRYAEPIHDRRLEAEDTERLLERSISDGKQALLVLLCGTEPFTAFIKSSLVKLGIENCYTF